MKKLFVAISAVLAIFLESVFFWPLTALVWIFGAKAEARNLAWGMTLGILRDLFAGDKRLLSGVIFTAGGLCMIFGKRFVDTEKWWFKAAVGVAVVLVQREVLL